MANFQIIFEDSVHGTQVAHFDSFIEAMEYWNEYADTETCVAGEFKTLHSDGIICEFDDRETEVM